MKRLLKIIQWSVLGIFLLTIAVSGLLMTGLYLHVAEDLPKISSLSEYRPPVVTSVYSDDNRKIAEFYRERRIVVPLSEMPKTLVRAFIAAEDSRFFDHKGVDYIGIIRAFIKNIEAGAIVQGGSTITQQVVKPFLRNYKRKSYARKLKEAILAYRIERRFTKENILWVYLNQIYLGHGAYGVAAAADNYFRKPLKDLNLAECAMLAGLPKAPSRYSPFVNMKKAKIRQIYVLNRMFKRGYISADQAREAVKTHLDIMPRRNWYRDTVPYYAEHIRRYIEEKFGNAALYEEGLQIYTTVNIEMQEAARREIKTGLKALEKRQKYQTGEVPQSALVCIEAGTGHVKAMVGGRDFSKSPFNRATQAKRQPGSAFKPIIYTAALDKGFTTTTLINDKDVTFWVNKKPWRPQNYDEEYAGPVTLREAFAHSRNVPAAKILNRIGVGYAVKYARKLGITSDLHKSLSLALGPSEVSLLELTTSYSVFANLGDLVQPVFIRKIIDRDGNEIKIDHPVRKKAIEANTAYIMTNLLQSVVSRGTGWRVRALERPVAGKTGTSNNLHDAWFLGYTPRYITGVWVGFDHLRPLGEEETGSRAASPIWLGFMKDILKDEPIRNFNIPKGVVFANSECFKKGSVPIRPEPGEEPDVFVSTGRAEPFDDRIIARPARPRSKPRVITGAEQFFKSSL